MDDLPVACSLGPDALAARRQGLLTQLIARAESRVELSDGVRLQFRPSSEVLGSILATIDAERQCCRFLRFTLTVAPDGGPLSLDLTGPPGTREFVSALFAEGGDEAERITQPDV